MKLLGIIPARGGSKGILKKNMQLLDNKPLVLHALEVAIESNAFDRIIVSSDDDEILNCVGNRTSRNIPLKRPIHLAQDDTPISAVIEYLLDWLQEKENYLPDAFMLLEPTCPLRQTEDINESLSLFQQSSKPCLISVSPAQQHPSNMIYWSEDRWQYCLARNNNAYQRQSFYPSWFINGAVYLTQSEFFLKTKSVYDLASCELYVMPCERSFDINTPFDLELVRMQHLLLKSKPSSPDPKPKLKPKSKLKLKSKSNLVDTTYA